MAAKNIVVLTDQQLKKLVGKKKLTCKHLNNIMYGKAPKPNASF